MFEVGDVVVCVDDSPCRCVNCMAGLCDPTMSVTNRALYRVEGVELAERLGTEYAALLLVGVPARPDHARGTNAARFRKVTRASDTFTASIKACRPAHRKTPVSA